MLLSILALISYLPGVYGCWWATQILYDTGSVRSGMPVFLVGLSIGLVGAAYFYNVLFTGWHTVFTAGYAFALAYIFIRFLSVISTEK